SIGKPRGDEAEDGGVDARKEDACVSGGEREVAEDEVQRERKRREPHDPWVSPDATRLVRLVAGLFGHFGGNAEYTAPYSQPGLHMSQPTPPFASACFASSET